MTGDTTVILGIEIPSTDPVFITVIMGIHVPLGLACVVAGAAAMLSESEHPRAEASGTGVHKVREPNDARSCR